MRDLIMAAHLHFHRRWSKEGKFRKTLPFCPSGFRRGAAFFGGSNKLSEWVLRCGMESSHRTFFHLEDVILANRKGLEGRPTGSIAPIHQEL